MISTLSTKMEDGSFLHMPIMDRQSVRHGWGERIEVGTRAEVHDKQTHPYTNWGFRDRLDHILKGQG